MKKLKCLAIIAATMASLNGYSQGTISFVGSAPNVIINSLTGLPAEANLLVVGLYFNTNPSAEASTRPDASGSDGFQIAPNTAGSLAPSAVRAGGTFIGGTKEIPGVDPGVPASFQVRAWSVGFATYEEAYAAGMTDNNILVGASDVLRFAPGGGSLPAAGLVAQGGYTGLTVAPVPEPSMIALSVLGGLGAMLLIRRRR
jgi:hypothetical protein